MSHNPTNILYIKLGAGGEYEETCLKNNTLKLGYHQIDHDQCLAQNWDFVTAQHPTASGATTSHVNQIRKFYDEPETTMWITFSNGKLWYCYADTFVRRNSDGTKERACRYGWRDKDVNGKELRIPLLSGRLTQVQAFRGTICNVKEKEYLLNKINCSQSPATAQVEADLEQLKSSIGALIQRLNPQDFELFVDLIFRSAAWSRIGVLGDKVKTIDIELMAPVTGERAIVQVKSKSSLKLLEDYRKSLTTYGSYDRIYFVTHSPDESLQTHLSSGLETEIEIWDTEKLADLSVDAGLIDWLINVAP